ncbi:MAG: PspA-associated protein PspAB [Streptosporangiaceae bacterium]
MGFLDTLLGRTKPVPPNLDALFALPSAAITLQAATDFGPTGTGSVCFRAAEGRAFSDIEKDVKDLLAMGDATAPVRVSSDSYGFTWLVCTHDPGDVEGLVTDLHAVNSSLEAGGFGPQLLCTLLSFRDSAGKPLGLVYLYKRGTFYPFAPQPGERRDNATELRIRGALGDDLKVEPDLGRWFPVWGAPGL